MVQIAGYALFVAGAVTLLWNWFGPVKLDGINETYSVKIQEGRLTGKNLHRDAVYLVKNWVEKRTRPEVRPIQVWQHQLWYNAVTEGYELKMWIEPGDRSAGKMYALYQTGTMIYLRIEFKGKNRVLRADFTALELERVLEQFVQEL